MRFFKKLIRIIRYVINVSRADDCWRKKKYLDALKFTKRAEAINPLLPNDLLRRAHIYLRLKEFSLSIDDAKAAITLIEKMDKHPKYDKDYLIYYASRLGTLSQCAQDKIAEDAVDRVFKKVRFENLVLSDVSKRHLSNFPLRQKVDNSDIMFNQ